MKTILFASLILLGLSCKKQKEAEGCGCSSEQREVVTQLPGVIVQTDDGLQILTDEKGLLMPCSELRNEFQREGQSVIVSGKLKTPCKKIPHTFWITPITISSLELTTSTYQKTDITLKVINSEDYGYNPGFGYVLEDLRSSSQYFKVLQPFIPAISGFIPFSSKEQATKVGLLVVYLRRQGNGLPSMTVDILKYIDVIN